MRKKQRTEPQVLINFEAPESLRDAIRLYCAQEKVTMKSFLNAAANRQLRCMEGLQAIRDTREIPYLSIDTDNEELKAKLRDIGIDVDFRS